MSNSSVETRVIEVMQTLHFNSTEDELPGREITYLQVHRIFHAEISHYVILCARIGSRHLKSAYLQVQKNGSRSPDSP